jgi:hypothetical protein
MEIFVAFLLFDRFYSVLPRRFAVFPRHDWITTRINSRAQLDADLLGLPSTSDVSLTGESTTGGVSIENTSQSLQLLSELESSFAQRSFYK